MNDNKLTRTLRYTRLSLTMIAAVDLLLPLSAVVRGSILDTQNVKKHSIYLEMMVHFFF